jgi:hypothetical protein
MIQGVTGGPGWRQKAATMADQGETLNGRQLREAEPDALTALA